MITVLFISLYRQTVCYENVNAITRPSSLGLPSRFLNPYRQYTYYSTTTTTYLLCLVKPNISR